MDYRNRYRIVTAAGPLLLSIPIIGGRRQSAALEDVRIDYTHAWQRQHWRTLLSAYGRAPFFEHYAPGLEAIVLATYERLLDFNLATIEWLGKEMQINMSLKTIGQLANALEMLPMPDTHVLESGAADIKPYHQVFEDRFGFVADLSAIDLLMNEGPYSAALL
jgi:hypothetical protein